RYNVSSAKKGILELDTTYQAPKKRIFMLPRGAKRPKRGFSCFCVARKDQKEILGVTAWRGKT
ncbi:MAG: hypothetical protein ACFN0J_04610, partial [Segatella salivae]